MSRRALLSNIYAIENNSKTKEMVFNFTSGGGEYNFDIQSTCSWDSLGSDDMFSLSQITGSAGHTSNIRVTATVNEMASGRTGHFVIRKKSNDGYVEINCTQEPALPIERRIDIIFSKDYVGNSGDVVSFSAVPFNYEGFYDVSIYGEMPAMGMTSQVIFNESTAEAFPVQGIYSNTLTIPPNGSFFQNGYVTVTPTPVDAGAYDIDCNGATIKIYSDIKLDYPI